MWVVHHKDTVLFFGLCFIVAFGHVSDCFAKACLPCLSYFRVGVSCKLFVLGDSFSHLRMHHSRTKVFDVDIVEVVLLRVLSLTVIREISWHPLIAWRIPHRLPD